MAFWDVRLLDVVSKPFWWSRCRVPGPSPSSIMSGRLLVVSLSLTRGLMHSHNVIRLLSIRLPPWRRRQKFLPIRSNTLPYARTRYWIMFYVITVNDTLFLNAETYTRSGSFVERGIDIQLPDVSPTRNVDWCNCACAASLCDITEP